MLVAGEETGEGLGTWRRGGGGGGGGSPPSRRRERQHTRTRVKVNGAVAQSGVVRPSQSAPPRAFAWAILFQSFFLCSLLFFLSLKKRLLFFLFLSFRLSILFSIVPDFTFILSMGQFQWLVSNLPQE